MTRSCCVTIKAILRAVSRFEVAEANDVALVQVDTQRSDVVRHQRATHGGTVIKQLRQHHDAPRRDTPVVMLTGHIGEWIVHDALRLKIQPRVTEAP